MELGSWAEWTSAILSGIAVIMIVWQVNYEDKNSKKEKQLERVLIKQEEIQSDIQELSLLYLELKERYRHARTNTDETKHKISLVLNRINAANYITVFAINKLKDLKYADLTETIDELFKELNKITHTSEIDKSYVSINNLSKISLSNMREIINE